MSDPDLIRLAEAAGTGSYDGRQEKALAELLALLTARRAIELYPLEGYADTDAPGGTYRAAVVRYSNDLATI